MMCVIQLLYSYLFTMIIKLNQIY